MSTTTLEQIQIESSDERDVLLLKMNKKQIAALVQHFSAGLPQEDVTEEVPEELKNFQGTGEGGKVTADLENDIKNVQL